MLFIFNKSGNYFNLFGGLFFVRRKICCRTWRCILYWDKSTIKHILYHYIHSRSSANSPFDRKVWDFFRRKWVAHFLFADFFSSNKLNQFLWIELNDPATAGTFLKLNEKIDRFCKLAYLGFVKITAPLFMLPVLFTTIFNYFILHLGDESFVLGSPF